MTNPIGFEVRLDKPYEQALEAVAAALKAEGFGVLTRVDVKATLKEKLGAEFRPYSILGVCNPPLAHRALSHNAEAGLFLPCHVTVEAAPDGKGSVVRIGDPDVVVKSGGMDRDPVLRSVSSEARARLLRAAEALSVK